jgi:predicted component of type VI protein secretion system
MILKLKYTTEDLEKARDLVDEAWDKLREARATNGTESVAWIERIDMNAVMADLEKLSNGLADRMNEVSEEGE